MPQVDIIETDYGASTYTKDNVRIVHIDLTRYADEYPSRSALDVIKEHASFLAHPDAIKFMTEWIKENEEGLEDLERPNDLLALQIEEAKAFLEKLGYEITS